MMLLTRTQGFGVDVVFFVLNTMNYHEDDTRTANDYKYSLS
jgi:hypothetical protein